MNVSLLLESLEKGPLAEYKTKKEQGQFFRLYSFVNFSENTISAFLFKLLNPNGDHGQGAYYLKDFCKYFLSKDKRHSMNIANEGEALERANKFLENIRERNAINGYTEYVLDASSRIDLLFQFEDGYVLGIENKPFADDQPSQLQRYVNLLSSRHPCGDSDKNIVVYLADWSPSEDSLPPKCEEVKNVVQVTFPELVQWLELLIKNETLETTRVYIKELRSEIMRAKGIMEETDSVVNYFWEHPDKLKEIQSLEEYGIEYNKCCLAYFFKELRNIVSGTWEVQENRDSKVGLFAPPDHRSCIGLLRLKTDKTVVVRLYAQEVLWGYNKFWFGVLCDNENNICPIEFLQVLSKNEERSHKWFENVNMFDKYQQNYWVDPVNRTFSSKDEIDTLLQELRKDLINITDAWEKIKR